MTGRKKLFGKRLLATLLAAAVVLTSADIRVTAAEAEEDLTEITSVIDDASEDSVEPGGTDASNDSAGTDGIDSSEDASETDGLGSPEDSVKSDDADTPDDSGAAGTNETADTEMDEEDGSGDTDTDEMELLEDISGNDIGVEEMSESGMTPLADEGKLIGSGKINKITWEIDGNGHLTVEGTGDYIKAADYNNAAVTSPPWTDEKYALKITSATVKITGITSTANMFQNCAYLRTVDVSGLDVSQVTDMSGMFCMFARIPVVSDDGLVHGTRFVSGSLQNLDVSGFDTSRVTSMRNMFAYSSSSESFVLDVSGFDTGRVQDMSGMFFGCAGLASLDVSGFDTGRVEDMSRMFSGCENLTSLDVSGFDTGRVENIDSMFSACSGLQYLDLSSFDLRTLGSTESQNFLKGCTGLNWLCTPVNCDTTIGLPASEKGWYGQDRVAYTYLPKGLSESMVLYNGDKDDASRKSIVSIDGITVRDKVYDREAYVYEGAAVLKEDSGNEITDVTMAVFYIGTLSDGTEYPRSAVAPSQAGSYTLFFEVSGLDTNRYILRKTDYRFRIRSRELTVTAPSRVIELNGAIPELTELTKEIKIAGLSDGDAITVQPQLKYSKDAAEIDAEKIPLDKADCYDIIPCGMELDSAVAGNYMINYVSGELQIGDPAEQIIASGTLKNGKDEIMWKISKAGKLTLEGHGYYWKSGRHHQATKIDLPWTAEGLRDKIVSAEVRVKNMDCTQDMFNGCKNLKSVDFSDFDTSTVRNMTAMFAGCESLESLDLSGFKTNALKYMGYGESRGMFADCHSLKSLDLSGFHMEADAIMDGLFENCYSLQSLKLDRCDTKNVTSMRGMFKNCRSLKTLEFLGFDTSNVIDMSKMFAGCTGLETVDLGGFKTGNVEYMEEMFAGCTALKRINLSGFDTGKVVRMSGMFRECSNLSDLDISSFVTSDVADISYMFSDCRLLSNLNFRGLDPFSGELIYISVDGRRMDGMFKNCSSLEALDLSGYHTEDVGVMREMFAGCSRLKELDFSAFDTSNVAEMSGMFSGCAALTDIDLSSFDVAAAKNMGDMFAGCNRLTYLFSPRNCMVSVQLPVSKSTDQWKAQDGTLYTELPKGVADSVLVYKNRYLENEKGELKQILSLSGIRVDSKVYDGRSNPFSGSAVVTDLEGTVLSDIVLDYVYTGTLVNGAFYGDSQSAEAPSQAGTYILSVNVAGAAGDQYIIRRNTFDFSIGQRALTIKAPTVIIDIDDLDAKLPDVAELRCTVEGLMEGEEKALPDLKEIEKDVLTGKLTGKLQMHYDPEPVSVKEAGRYAIKLNEADAGNNYYINYIDGILLIGKSGDVLPDDLPQDGVIPEGLWIAGLSDEGYDYTGKAIKPEVRVYDHKTLLKEKTDYTIAYKNNTKAYAYSSSDQEFEAKKAPTITVVGKGNYTGKETQMFKILPLNIGAGSDVSGNIVFAADDMAVAYKRNAKQQPVPVLMWNDKKLKNKSDYTVAYFTGTGRKKLDFVTDAGNYYIEMTGKGNFTGTYTINLTVTDSLKLMSKMSIGKVKNQPYTGSAIIPELVVKDGKTVLTENTHYTVSYSRNTAVGTAYIVVRGIESKGYSGTKRISFKITGTPIRNAVVEDRGGKEWRPFKGREYIYNGTDFEPELRLSMQEKKDGVVTARSLAEGTDYIVSWQKNQNAGTATVTFTGRGAYTGTLKKTFKIKPFDIAVNDGSRVEVKLENPDGSEARFVPYAKGGAKPKVKVTFADGSGRTAELTEGVDYTLTYKNNKAVNDGSDPKRIPAVTIKGKGNFKGTYGAVLSYQIVQQDIKNLTLTAADKTYQNKKNIYATKITVTDLDGKTLGAGKDYDNKTITYAYRDETVLDNGMVRVAGEILDKEKGDIIPAGTVLKVTVSAKDGGNYTGTLSSEYRITKASIGSASISIPNQIYTGQAITPDKSQVTVKIKKDPVDASQYEIVPDSYKNNIKKGTASVTIQGVDNYGGTKTVKFSIKAKGFLWWWRNF